MTESLFDWPTATEDSRRNSKMSSDDAACEEAPCCGVNLVKQEVFSANQVTYMHDRIGLHRIANESENGSVSLHLYSPPFQYCKTFCERTGAARSSGKCVFYSIDGEKQTYIEDINAKLYGLSPVVVQGQE